MYKIAVFSEGKRLALPCLGKAKFGAGGGEEEGATMPDGDIHD